MKYLLLLLLLSACAPTPEQAHNRIEEAKLACRCMGGLRSLSAVYSSGMFTNRIALCKNGHLVIGEVLAVDNSDCEFTPKKSDEKEKK